MPSRYGVESIQDEQAKQREFNAQKAREEATGKASSKVREEEYKRWKQEKVQKAKDTIRQNASVIQDVVNDVSKARGLRPWDIQVKEKDGDIVVAFDTRWGNEAEKMKVAGAIAEILTKQTSIPEVETYDANPRDRNRKYEENRMRDYDEQMKRTNY